jgi:hypothetical protein
MRASAKGVHLSDKRGNEAVGRQDDHEGLVKEASEIGLYRSRQLVKQSVSRIGRRVKAAGMGQARKEPMEVSRAGMGQSVSKKVSRVRVAGRGPMRREPTGAIKAGMRQLVKQWIRRRYGPSIGR